ncbi:hypothetical protein LRS13_04390 [Svornostia abyssi]|uniref:SRP54-type proteins GTP-binding domain-containing protein n=1 Tax=Svornostia abyssi TaxID=2898438 RepID=A0ABY5PK29_9ACTN|nr:hypothetical protein LRS13_04390 [Parviterribacteraceae bacterium J379]
MTDTSTAAPTASVAEAMLAQAGSAGFGEKLAEAQEEQAALAPEPAPAQATVGSALTVDDILGGAPAPAPKPAARVFTSPQVDALPSAVVPEPEPQPEPEPEPVAAVPAPPAPAPVAPAPAAAPSDRPAKAARATDILTDRGLSPAFSAHLVDEVLAYRAPLQPGARLTTLVSRELAQRIPVSPLGRPGVSAWVGAGGSGKTNAIAALARAHTEAGSLQVACVSLRTPDGGATLRTALQGADVHVYVPADDAEAVALVAQLSAAGMTVIVDTPSISPRNAAEIKALGRRLRRMGVEDVHLCIPATLGLEVARDVLAATSALKPTALTITHADETERVGAAIQLAIDAALPVGYINEGGSTGRGLRAADPVELAKAIIG